MDWVAGIRGIRSLIVWGTRRPTPQEETNPLARQRAYGGLVGLPLVALRRRIDPRPAGMPERCGRPRDARVPEERWTREAPVDPRLLAAACGHRRDPGLCLPCGGGRAFPLCAPGGAPPGGEAGTCPGAGLAQGNIGRALRALDDGVITGLDGLPGDPERVDEGLAKPGLRGATALIGGQGAGGLDGV
jgi:hypothetical protein